MRLIAFSSINSLNCILGTLETWRGRPFSYKKCLILSHVSVDLPKEVLRYCRWKAKQDLYRFVNLLAVADLAFMVVSKVI